MRYCERISPVDTIVSEERGEEVFQALEPVTLLSEKACGDAACPSAAHCIVCCSTWATCKRRWIYPKGICPANRDKASPE